MTIIDFMIGQNKEHTAIVTQHYQVQPSFVAQDMHD